MSDVSPNSNAIELRRRAIVTAVVAVAFLGFFIGVRQTQPFVPYSTAVSDTEHGAPPARSHAELAANPWRVEQQPWTPPLPAGGEPVTTADREAREAALAERAQRRAFDGAPPTIPHPVSQASGVECLACHAQGGVIAGRLAPPMSHQPYTMCTQCHAAEVPGIAMAREPSRAATAATLFAGLRRAPAPFRWTEGSPPQTPHPTHMRERCESCHGVGGRPGLQTSHPERLVCQQCHASSAVVDQRGAVAP